MLRPERMSKVSVTGAKSVMPTTVEAVHELNLLHLSDYDGSWAGFDNGSPTAGAEEASEKLITIRSLKSTLGLSGDEEFPPEEIDEGELETRLEEIRADVTELDDHRSELRENRRDIDNEIEQLQPFTTLGIDLDLLSEYDSIDVAVGRGNRGEIDTALAEADEVRAYELFGEGDVLAPFAAPAGDADAPIDDALVGVEFSRVEIPDADGDPESEISELERERRELESELESVESELERIKHEHGGFLLTAEEELSIEVDRAEAPLRFATTDHSFVAEGWIPSERYDELVDALQTAVGDRLEIEELERADYDRHGHPATHEEVEHEKRERQERNREADEEETQPTAEDEAEQPAVADGGAVTMPDDGPPVKQDNPTGTKSFELLTKAVGSPNYTEFDPTVLLFATFPLMFGFIIGDIGYGLIYTAIGYYFYSSFDSKAFRQIGVIAAGAGIATMIFGVLYGEVFGLHLDTLIGFHPPLAKGLSPGEGHWATGWFVVTTLFGVLHLTIGYVLEFIEEYKLHGIKPAMTEAGSWLLALNGLWMFIFSKWFSGPKPEFLYTTFDGTSGGEEVEAMFALGFDGLPVVAGYIGVVMFGLGLALLIAGPAHEFVEIHVALAHALSYLRLSAVLLAKAGMAFAVNLLFFGAYLGPKDGEFHFLLDHGPEHVVEEYGESAIIFDGLIHGGAAALILGIFVLIVGHIVVLLLGITSAGIQSIRLEYFEFFSKFYEGNGQAYMPFGRDQSASSDQ